ncbi:MAG: hypothetical protein SFV21_15880 [Rhodospirillaceae bacterium]|nr:hypothetical protein [Rhodospirillaceae bacterium]
MVRSFHIAAFGRVTLFVATLAASGAASACTPGAPAGTTLAFAAPQPPPDYRYDKSVNSIQHMMREQGHVFAGLNAEWTLGVTYAKPTVSVDGDLANEPGPDGACSRLDWVRVVFGYADIEVYIGSDFKPGTCAFRAVYDHETQHVSINAYTLEEFAKTLKAQLDEQARRQTAVRAGAADLDAMLAPYRRLVDEAAAAFRVVQASRNAAIDTRDSYARVQAMCGDWNQSNTWVQQGPVQRAPSAPAGGSVQPPRALPRRP